MTCKQARQLLAAYRQDDNSLSEHAELQAHLLGCAACRARAAEFRRVGESLQSLPQLAPPPDFYARVMAAVRADEAKVTEQASTQQKKPATVVVPGLTNITHFPALRRSVVERRLRLAPMRRQMTPAATFAMRYSVALAAVFLIFSLGMSLALLRLLRSPVITTCVVCTSTRPLPLYYNPDPAYPLVADATASADGQFVIYAAHNASGKWMLEELNRQTKMSVALLPAPVSEPLSLKGWARSWVLWMQGSPGANTGWELNATELSPALPGAGPTLLLVRGDQVGPDGKVVALHGLSASGLTVLLAEELADGRGQLVSLDLTHGTTAARSVLMTADPDHLIMDPTSDGTDDYWVDTWYGSDGTLHGDIWRLLPDGSSAPVTSNAGSFAPMIIAGKLVWLEEPLTQNAEVVAENPPPTQTPPPQATLTPGGGSASTPSVAGILWSEGLQVVKGQTDLDAGPRIAISDTNRLALLPQAGATFVVWQDSGGSFYLYDLVKPHTQPLNEWINNALVLAVSPTAVLWVTADSQNGNQPPLKTIINLLDWS